MIPLRDQNPTRTVPYVTYAIILLNVIVYLYGGPMGPEGNRLSGYLLIPQALTSGSGGQMETAIPPWLTIFTAMFMHANLLHIAGNMLYFWIFGDNIEDVLGHVRFLFFYLACGFLAAIAQVFMAPDSTAAMLGASGAIAGVLGAYLLLFPRARVLTLVFIVFFIQVITLPAELILGFWIVIQVLNSLISPSTQGGVAYAAHIGGFAAGIILILMFGGRRLLDGRRPVNYDRGRWHDGN